MSPDRSLPGALGLIAASLAASVALVAAYLAMGGASYEPTPVQDPCAPRAWRSPGSLEQDAEQFTLSALDGAACELQVSRETLAVALATEESRREFGEEYGISDPELEAAVRAGVIRGIDDAEDAGAIPALVAGSLKQVASRLPVDEAIGLIQDGSALFEEGQGLLEQGGDLLEGLIP
jgi:hypothetical protein